MYLFLLIIFLISYGSLYPFDFVQLANESADLKTLFKTWGSYTHQGDILANLILFIPFGIIGTRVIEDKFNQFMGISIILLFGLCFSIILQVGQIYLPSRDANLSDAVLNFIGTIIGVFIAVSLNTKESLIAVAKPHLNSFPILLLFSWFAYRLMPFIPSIDWQEIKNGVKPIFLFSTWELSRIFHDATAWLIVFYILCRHMRKKLPIIYFSRLILLCFTLEIIIVNNTVSLSNVVGAILALVSWWAFFSYLTNISAWLAIMLLITLFVSGFSPYQLSASTQTMQLIPFYGFLAGSMLVNTASLLEKFFLYGALVWLLQNLGLKLWAAILITVSVTSCIEFGQIFLVGHLAEITDPLLVILIGLLIGTVDKTVGKH
ncbi:MAG: VanZ family protein [Methylococcales bacterium]